MKITLGRATTVVAAAALLLGSVAAPASAVPPRIPWDKPIPVPEGDGYACWAFQDRQEVRCTYTDHSKRWRDAEQYHGCEQRADGWRVCIDEQPNHLHPGTACDDPRTADNPMCRWERDTGTPLDPSMVTHHGPVRIFPAWEGNTSPGRTGWLAKGDWLESKNWKYRVVFQPDGNLVSYGAGGKVLWHSGTWGNPGANFIFQADGNAVIYAPDGRPLWYSGSWGNPGGTLTVDDKGSLQVRRANGSVAWATPAAK